MQQRTSPTGNTATPLPMIYAQAFRETKNHDNAVNPALSPVVVAARPLDATTDDGYLANSPESDTQTQNHSRESAPYGGEVGYIIHNQPPSALTRRLPENQIAVARPVDPSRVLRNGWTGTVARSNDRADDQEERWSSSVLSCCDDANICIWVCCATPHAWATVAAAVNHQSFHLALIVYGFPW
mmetsp:Transcript_2596/g.3959  ORF Transcript_2596/g.3959 Transcript_2596/m.3959 type:complete len:184 (+) Transcript_2596:141-692(+)